MCEIVHLCVCVQVPMNLEAENPEEWQKEEQERIDNAEPLSEEQQQEKESLLQQVSLSPHLVQKQTDFSRGWGAVVVC